MMDAVRIWYLENKVFIYFGNKMMSFCDDG
jgi:hypothetical protein